MIWRGRPIESYAAKTSRDDCARAYALFCDQVAVLWPKLAIRDIATELDCSEKARVIRETWRESGWQWRREYGDVFKAEPYPRPKFVASAAPIAPQSEPVFHHVTFRRQQMWDGCWVLFGSYQGLEIQIGTAPPTRRSGP
jgi:hypothetical protein